MKILMLWLFCVVHSVMADSDGLQHLQKIMSSSGTANITQNSSDGKTEKGKLHWNGQKKCIRVEMEGGVVYLYTEGGMHIKESNKDWSHVALPNDWSKMLLDPESLMKDKGAEVHTVKDDTYGLHLEEGGRFIYLFWTKDQLKGWIIGSMEQGTLHNEISVDLEKAPPAKLSDSDWMPGSNFLEIR